MNFVWMVMAMYVAVSVSEECYVTEECGASLGTSESVYVVNKEFSIEPTNNWILLVLCLIILTTLYVLLKTILEKNFRTTYSLQDVFKTIPSDSISFFLTGAGYKGNSELLTVWKSAIDAYLKSTKSKNVTLFFDGDKVNLPHDLTIGNATKELYDYLVKLGYTVTVIAMIGDAAYEKHRLGENNSDLCYYGNKLMIFKTHAQWVKVLQDGKLVKKPAYTGPDTKQGVGKLECLEKLFTTGRPVIFLNLFGGQLAIEDTRMGMQTHCNIVVWHTKLSYIESLHKEAISAGYIVAPITCNGIEVTETNLDKYKDGSIFTFDASPK